MTNIVDLSLNLNLTGASSPRNFYSGLMPPVSLVVSPDKQHNIPIKSALLSDPPKYNGTSVSGAGLNGSYYFTPASNPIYVYESVDHPELSDHTYDNKTPFDESTLYLTLDPTNYFYDVLTGTIIPTTPDKKISTAPEDQNLSQGTVAKDLTQMWILLFRGIADMLKARSQFSNAASSKPYQNHLLYNLDRSGPASLNSPSTWNWPALWTWMIPDEKFDGATREETMQNLNEFAANDSVYNAYIKLGLYCFSVAKLLDSWKQADDTEDPIEKQNLQMIAAGQTVLYLFFALEKFLSFFVKNSVSTNAFGSGNPKLPDYKWGTRLVLAGHILSSIAYLGGFVSGYGMLRQEMHRFLEAHASGDKYKLNQNDVNNAIQNMGMLIPKWGTKGMLFITSFIFYAVQNGEQAMLGSMNWLFSSLGLLNSVSPRAQSLGTTPNDPYFDVYNWVRGAQEFPFIYTIIFGAVITAAFSPGLYTAKNNLQDLYRNKRETWNNSDIKGISLLTAEEVETVFSATNIVVLYSAAMFAAYPQSEPHSTAIYILGTFIMAASYFTKHKSLLWRSFVNIPSRIANWSGSDSVNEPAEEQDNPQTVPSEDLIQAEIDRADQQALSMRIFLGIKNTIIHPFATASSIIEFVRGDIEMWRRFIPLYRNSRDN